MKCETCCFLTPSMPTPICTRIGDCESPPVPEYAAICMLYAPDKSEDAEKIAHRIYVVRSYEESLKTQYVVQETQNIATKEEAQDEEEYGWIDTKSEKGPTDTELFHIVAKMGEEFIESHKKELEGWTDFELYSQGTFRWPLGGDWGLMYCPLFGREDVEVTNITGEYVEFTIKGRSIQRFYKPHPVGGHHGKF